MKSTSSPYVAGRTINMPDGEYLFFSGTGYLGIHLDPIFRKHIEDGFDLYGTNFGNSRNANYGLPIFDAAERQLADNLGSPDVLMVSSGLLAGQLLVNNLPKQNTHWFYAPDTHPALLVVNAQVPEISRNAWQKALLNSINQCDDSQHCLILSNSFDALHGQLYDFSFLGQIKADKNVMLVIDDSHGMGILGKTGQGLYSELSVYENINLLVVGSLGKALGVPAGFIAGNAEIITKLRQTAMYSGASPASPAYLHAYLQSQQLYERNLVKLRENIQFFNEQVQELSFIKTDKDLPIFWLDRKDAAKHLLKNKILVFSSSYPKVDGDALDRIVLSCLHTKSDLVKLADAVRSLSQD